MNHPLAITRCALLTPLDSANQSTWGALREGRKVERAVSVDDALLDPDDSLDRSLRLGLAVARQVLHGPATDTLLFCGTSKGPATTTLAALEQLRQGRPPSPAQARQIALGVGAMGTIVAERLGLPAGHTSVAACSSGLHALHRAAQALQRGECRRALVVAADASLHELFEASFTRLGVLVPKDAQGIRHCEPFAREGRGFFLAEAAAALLLKNVDQTDPPPLAWLDRCWIGADSTGLIAIDETADSLRGGLSGFTPNGSALGFVHAHATGTEHDQYELNAIREFAGDQVPVFSHKAWIGHSLGAAGLVSVALSALCHQHQTLPTGEPVAPGVSSITIAQGFGGHIALARLRGT